MKKIFVDGQEGTTGLQIRDKLLALASSMNSGTTGNESGSYVDGEFDGCAKGGSDGSLGSLNGGGGKAKIELLEIAPELRKDKAERARLLNEADVAFLCLPDDAASESVSLVENPNTVIIDTSTAHRTNEEWAYGLPELSPTHREKIKNSKRIANPGCHATGFLLAAYPLVANGIIKADENLSCYSLTGYSGGGKKMIAEYKEELSKFKDSKDKNGTEFNGAEFESQSVLASKPYALALNHKHLPEMQKISGLEKPPLFNPILGPYYQGMTVTVGLFKSQFSGGSAGVKDFNELRDFLSDYYKNSEFVKVVFTGEHPHRLDPTTCNGTNNAFIYVFGNETCGQISVVLDNLGKGASGAAVQNMLLSF